VGERGEFATSQVMVGECGSCQVGELGLLERLVTAPQLQAGQVEKEVCVVGLCTQ
jgi:hypothetical protein